jgi:hypothetical protein
MGGSAHAPAEAHAEGPHEIPPAPSPRSITPAPEDFARTPPAASLLWPLFWMAAAALLWALVRHSGWRWLGAGH